MQGHPVAQITTVSGIELPVRNLTKHIDVNHCPISQAKQPLYVLRRHGRRAGRRFQKHVITLAHEAGLAGRRNRWAQPRGKKTDQFRLLFQWQCLRGGFNLEQCAHAENLSLTSFHGKYESRKQKAPIQTLPSSLCASTRQGKCDTNFTDWHEGKTTTDCGRQKSKSEI